MLRVAHIDDSPEDRLFFTRMCKAASVECVSFSGVTEFLDDNQYFDVVFTDLNLMEFYQIEVIDQVKKRGLPVYVLSGVGNNDIDTIKEVYIEAGAVDFISKDVFFRGDNGAYYLSGLSHQPPYPTNNRAPKQDASNNHYL
jgi:DNA-binding NtrC family response regulator